MAVNRWIVLLALPLLPACVLTGKQTAPEQPPAPIEPVREFAVLPRVPGERVALSNPDEVQPGQAKPLAHQPIADPDLTEIAPPTPQPLQLTEPPSSAPVLADPPLVAAVRAYLDNRPDLALEHLRALDKPNQELMLQLIPAFVQAARMNLAQPSSVDVGMLVAQLEAPNSPLAALAAKAPLFVDKAMFCRDIRGFGRYTPFQDQATLKTGQIVFLYVELRNTPSVRTATAADGEVFETALDCTLQIQDARGGVVELFDQKAMKLVPILHDPKRDLTRSPIRDYFIAFQFPVPVKPGDYAVTVGVHHAPTHRAVSRTMRFRAQ
jgi:hypothetical protein